MDKKFPLKRNNPTNGYSRLVKNVIFVSILLLIGVVILAATNQAPSLKEISLTQAVQQANSGQYSKITVNGNELDITKKGTQSASLKTFTEPNATLKDEGFDYSKVQIVTTANTDNSGLWLTIAGTVIPVIAFVGLIYFMMRSAQGQGNQALSFGKSRARLYGNEQKKVTFGDIAGSGEAKQDLQEVVEFLKFPKKFACMGARIPKGVLLIGPPGTGKTLLARAVAGEANVPFFSISGSEFVEMFVGVGASRVRDLFAKAKKNAPCIIFIDEIDAVGRRRGSGMGGGHDEREQTLNQILVEMDGFEQGQNVIVIAATNRADVLDPALLRPGRFDRRVNIDLPDRRDREAILKVHFAKKPLAKSVDLDALAAKSAGSSGADLANIANESAIIAARNNHSQISQSDVTEAFERVAIGPERKSKVMNDKEKELTAYLQRIMRALGAFADHVAKHGADGWTPPVEFLDLDEQEARAVMENFVRHYGGAAGQGLLSQWQAAQRRAEERRELEKQLLAKPLSAISGAFRMPETSVTDTDPHMDGVHQLVPGQPVSSWAVNGQAPRGYIGVKRDESPLALEIAFGPGLIASLGLAEDESEQK